MAKKKPVTNTGKKFERIVGSLYREIAGDLVIVTEDLHVPAIGDPNDKRQIDTLLQTSIVGLSTPISIVVESKDYGRPVGVGRVDELIGKVEDTGAIRGILVSNSGFTEGARRRARRHGGVELSHALDWREQTIRKRLVAPHLWIFHEVKQPIATLMFFRFYGVAHRINDTEYVEDLAKRSRDRVTEELLKKFEYAARDRWFNNGRAMPLGDNEFRQVAYDDFEMRIELHSNFEKTTRYFYKEDEQILVRGFYDELNQKLVDTASIHSLRTDFKWIKKNYKEMDASFDASSSIVYEVLIGIGRDDRIPRGGMLLPIQSISAKSTE